MTNEEKEIFVTKIRNYYENEEKINSFFYDFLINKKSLFKIFENVSDRKQLMKILIKNDYGELGALLYKYRKYISKDIYNEAYFLERREYLKLIKFNFYVGVEYQDQLFETLDDIPRIFLKDEIIIINMIKNDTDYISYLIENISDEVKDNCDLIYKIAKINYYAAYEMANDKIKNNLLIEKEQLLSENKMFYNEYQRFHDEKKYDNQKLYNKIQKLKKYDEVKKYMRINNNKINIFEIIKLNEHLKHNKSFMLDAINVDYYLYNILDKDLKHDFDILKKYIESSGCSDYFNSMLDIDREPKTKYDRFITELINNRDFVLNSLKNKYPKKDSDYSFPKIIYKKYKNDKEILMEIITINPELYKDFEYEIRYDKEIALYAVKQNGLLINDVGYILLKDKEIITEAIKQNKEAIQYVSNI